MSKSESILLGRRPILTKTGRLFAWQILIGAGTGEALLPEPETSERATQAWLGNVGAIDWEALCGGGRVLIPMDRRLLFSNVFEALPRSRVLAALAPMDEIDSSVAARLHQLARNFGVRLALLGYGRRDPRELVLELADLVEVDSGSMSANELGLVLRRAHRRELPVWSRSLRLESERERDLETGFDLFSGVPVIEPDAGGEAQPSTEGQALLSLLTDSQDGVEIDKAASKLGEHPQLAEQLLRLVNSLELARAQRIASVEQALIMVGAQGLTRWLVLLLFRLGGRDSERTSLFRIAASRGRLMELLALEVEGDGPEAKRRAETAFVVGILSMSHILLGLDRQTALDQLPYAPPVRAALAGEDGLLGALLGFAEALDAGRFEDAAARLESLEIDPRRVLPMQTEAIRWVAKLDSGR